MLDSKANQKPNVRNTITVRLGKLDRATLILHKKGSGEVIKLDEYLPKEGGWIRIIRKH